jgi:hypothetical protein
MVSGTVLAVFALARAAGRTQLEATVTGLHYVAATILIAGASIAVGTVTATVRVRRL